MFVYCSFPVFVPFKEQTHILTMVKTFHVIIYIFSLFICTNTEGEIKLSNCGGVIKDQLLQRIYYTSSGANENCVWTIVNQHHEGISVELEAADFKGPGELFGIFYLKNERGGALRKAWCSQKLNRVGDICQLETPTLFVVFNSASEGLGGTSFQIALRLTGRAYYQVRKNFAAFNDRRPSGFINYDESIRPDDIYRETKLSWVVNPTNNSKPIKLTLFKSMLTKYYNGTCERKWISVYQLPSISTKDLEDPKQLQIGVCEVYEKSPIIFKGDTSEPLILIFQDILFRPDRLVIKFYWNLDHPPHALLSGAMPMNTLYIYGSVHLVLATTLSFLFEQSLWIV